MAGSLEMEVEKNNISIQEAEAELIAAAAGESVAAIAEGGEVGTAEQQASEGLTRADDDAVAYGFGRPVLQKKKPLVGSVDHYERHVFLCYHAAESWPAKIEKGAYEPLPNSMVSALRNRKTDMPKKVGFFHSPRHHHLFFFFFFFFFFLLPFCVCSVVAFFFLVSIGLQNTDFGPSRSVQISNIFFQNLRFALLASRLADLYCRSVDLFTSIHEMDC
jgi:hypothetical protein